MDAALMKQLETMEKTLAQVEEDTARLRSDSNDIKIELNVMKTQIANLQSVVDKLNGKIIGNGNKGYDARMEELQADVDANTEFRLELKQEFRKFIWAALALLVGNLLLNILGL